MPSEKFVEAHGGKLGNISIYGQGSNATTRRLAKIGALIDRVHRDPTEAAIEKIVSTHHLQRWDVGKHLDGCEKCGIVCELQPPYADRAGFCKSDSTADIVGHGYPPDLQEAAVRTVLAQAELLCAEWG